MSTSTRYFAGYAWFNNILNDSFQGVSSFAILRPSFLCTNSPLASGQLTMNWVMIVTPDAKSWAQMGIWRNSSGVYRHFWQEHIHDTSSYPTTFLTNTVVPNGQQYAYQVLYNNQTLRFDYRLDSVTWGSSGFNPMISWPGTGWYVQYSAETNNLQNDIMGAAGSRFVFRGMGVQRNLGGSPPYGSIVTVPPGLSGVNYNIPRWGVNATASDYTESWTL